MIEKFSFNNSFGKKINIKNCLIINFFFQSSYNNKKKKLKNILKISKIIQNQKISSSFKLFNYSNFQISKLNTR